MTQDPTRALPQPFVLKHSMLASLLSRKGTLWQEEGPRERYFLRNFLSWRKC